MDAYCHHLTNGWQITPKDYKNNMNKTVKPTMVTEAIFVKF